MNNTVQSPSSDLSITALRINPLDLPRYCTYYYAFTGPDRKILMDPRNECWSDPSKAVQTFQLISAQLWGYDPANFSPAQLAKDSAPIRHTVQLDLTARLQMLTTDVDLAKDGYLLLKFAIASIVNRQLSPFTNHSLLKVIYHPERRLGRVLSCEHPGHKYIYHFDYVPSICQNDQHGLLPLGRWPHRPK